MRDYKKEYADFHSKPEQIKRRAGRNAARRKMEDQGRARNGDGMDVDHKDRNALNNCQSNLRMLKARLNRAKK